MNVLHDIRFAVRLLAKHRWFTLAATMALALGIGMNAMVFTLVNALLLRSLPFEDPDRVMYVGERDTVTGRTFMVSWPDFEDWRDSQKSFVGLAAWSVTRRFDTLGLALTRGRAFADVDGTPGHEVGIVNQRFVSMYFASEDLNGIRESSRSPRAICRRGGPPRSIRSARCDTNDRAADGRFSPPDFMSAYAQVARAAADASAAVGPNQSTTSSDAYWLDESRLTRSYRNV